MQKKNNSKEEDLRNRVYFFADLHPLWSKSAIAKHFMLENIPRSTIFSILQRKARKISPKRIVGSGRISVKMKKANVAQLKKRIDHKDGVSQNMLARKFDVTQQYINKIIRTKTTIRYRKKVKVPKRTPQQKAAVRPKCHRLAGIFQKKSVVIDDESYFGLSDYALSGNSGYYTSNDNETPDAVKLKRKSKFDPKILVWVAISSKGISKPYIVPSGQAVNEVVYINKCLRARLIPFVESVHKNDQIVFWPDLASAHYSNMTQGFLASNNIEYVPKVHNPANVPELRPIEDFWSEIKRLVYENNWQAENIKQLANRIRYAFNKVDINRVHRLGKATFTRVDRVRRHGMQNL